MKMHKVHFIIILHLLLKIPLKGLLSEAVRIILIPVHGKMFGTDKSLPNIIMQVCFRVSKVQNIPT